MDLEKQLITNKYIVLLTKQDTFDFLRKDEKLYDCKVSLTIGSDIPQRLQKVVMNHVSKCMKRLDPPESLCSKIVYAMIATSFLGLFILLLGLWTMDLYENGFGLNTDQTQDVGGRV